MTAVLFVLIVSIVNIAVGYALATHFGGVRQEVGELPIQITPSEPVAKPAEKPAAPAPEVATKPKEEKKETPAHEEGNFEQALNSFKGRLNSYTSELSELDRRMRDTPEEGGGDAMQECISDIKKTNEQYLKDQAETVEHLAEEKDDLGELSEAGRQVEEALDEQSKQILSTNIEIHLLYFKTNAKADRKKLLEETSKISNVNHTLESKIESAEYEVAKQEGREDQLGDEQLRDQLTGLLSMTGIKQELQRIWKRDPHHIRPTNVALIAIDKFLEFNTAHGEATGDQILKTFADTVCEKLTDENIACRYEGGAFFLILPEFDQRAATQETERIRQAIESTKFIQGEKALTVTASCAVAHSAEDDTSDTLFDRVEEALGEAQRSGRNRTFQIEEERPTPVLPPNLNVAAREVTIE